MNTFIKEDNRITMLLVKSGRLPSRRRNKHLDSHYLYVEDPIARGIVQVDHCVSDEMITLV